MRWLVRLAFLFIAPVLVVLWLQKNYEQRQSVEVQTHFDRWQAEFEVDKGERPNVFGQETAGNAWMYDLAAADFASGDLAAARLRELGGETWNLIADLAQELRGMH